MICFEVWDSSSAAAELPTPASRARDGTRMTRTIRGSYRELLPKVKERTSQVPRAHRFLAFW